jgi:nitronate monooxygenase
MQPDGIEQWAADFRAETNGAFQINLWIPDPPPLRDVANETSVRRFLETWGPAVAAGAAYVLALDFAAQSEAMLAAGPAIISSIMGVYPPDFVTAMHDRGVKWFAAVTTVADALEAEAAGADVIVAQGAEAGGHRSAFNAGETESRAVGLFALLPAVVDAVSVPVVATGGNADGRGVAAALMLGASAAQNGTGLLRTPEAALKTAWADAIGDANPEDTIVTRAFSGRAGHVIHTKYALAATTSFDAPAPAPYRPIQRSLTQAMRDQGGKDNDIDRILAWAGQSAELSSAMPAEELVSKLWVDAKQALGGYQP